jgi:hypothetical protein
VRYVASALSALSLAATTTPSMAREVACRFEAGVVVVPASVAGFAGDYIFDTGSAQTLLHETRAGAEGLTGPEVTGSVRIAGLTLPPRRIGISDLDARTWNLATPVIGVVGADVLQGLVVDIAFSPCRLRLARPGEEGVFKGAARPAIWSDGRPMVEAVVSDGARQLTGPFILATGANAPIRIADDLASIPGASRPSELYPEGVWLARLPSLRLADRTFTDVGSGLTPPEGDSAGVIGGAILANFRLRFDFAGGRVLIASAR